MVGRQSCAPPENVPINKGNRPEQIASAVSTSRSRECGRWMAAPDATDRVAGGGGAGPRGQVAVQEGPGAGTLGPDASGGPGERKARGELARQAAAVQTRPEPPGCSSGSRLGRPHGQPHVTGGEPCSGQGTGLPTVTQHLAPKAVPSLPRGPPGCPPYEPLGPGLLAKAGSGQAGPHHPAGWVCRAHPTWVQECYLKGCPSTRKHRGGEEVFPPAGSERRPNGKWPGCGIRL